MGILKIVFPLLMVAGALGSLVVNIVSKGDWATNLQWLGACLLYTALTVRNLNLGGSGMADKRLWAVRRKRRG